MASLPAHDPAPSLDLATSTERCAHALLACLSDHAFGAELATSERGLADRSDPVAEHARETRRLVGQLLTHLSTPVAPRVASPPPAGLTRREIEVLDAVADGLSTIEIAAVLHISVNTARNHVQRILDKLGVHSRLQAVNVAARHGLLQRLAG